MSLELKSIFPLRVPIGEWELEHWSIWGPARLQQTEVKRRIRRKNNAEGVKDTDTDLDEETREEKAKEKDR